MQEHPTILGRDGASASGAGKSLVPARVKVQPGFECGFAQGSRPSKALPQRRVDCHAY